jgi:hypothetical protein
MQNTKVVTKHLSSPKISNRFYEKNKRNRLRHGRCVN